MMIQDTIWIFNMINILHVILKQYVLNTRLLKMLVVNEGVIFELLSARKVR